MNRLNQKKHIKKAKALLGPMPGVQQAFFDVESWHPLSWKNLELSTRMFPIEYRVILADRMVAYAGMKGNFIFGRDKKGGSKECAALMECLDHKGPIVIKYQCDFIANCYAAEMENFAQHVETAMKHHKELKYRPESVPAHLRSVMMSASGANHYVKKTIIEGKLSHEEMLGWQRYVYIDDLYISL